MSKILTLLFLLLFPLVSFSQTDAIKLLDLGFSNFQSGRYSEAIENFTEIIEMIDDLEIQKYCLINRGLSYDKIAEYDLAIADFTEAIKIDSTDMASFIDRGLANMHAGNLEKAMDDYLHVVRDNSDYRMMEASLYWLSKIHYSQGQFDSVITYCNQYVLINSNDPEVYFIRGAANDMLLKYEESILDYTKALEISHNYVQAIANRGTAKINLLTTRGNTQPTKKETKDACKDLIKAKKLGDNSVEDLIFIYCK